MIKYEVLAVQSAQDRLNNLGKEKVEEAVLGVLRRAVFKIQSHIVSQKINGQLLHRRTGNLGNSIAASAKVQRVSDKELSGSVGTNVWYGLLHEFGNGETPFFIFPKKPGGMLAWKGSDGKMVFRPYVIHPGFKARRYIRSGFEEKLPEIHTDFSNAISKLLDGE